jgi:ligand-binding SRPBCC domain-containing protein
MGKIHVFTTEQKIPASIDQVWDFISQPANLKEITPSYMGFDIKSQEDLSKMYAGMIISYAVKPLFNFPLRWVTEITHVQDKEYFVDEQRFGPYALWHHKHFIKPIEGGVLMTDIIHYKLPLGFLGDIGSGFVRGKLKEIFDFRFAAVEKKFGKL